jgi:hypothetical protein
MHCRKSLLAILTLSVSTCLCVSARALDYPDGGTPATFTVSKRTQVPGETLKPGSYTIQVIDHISDRIVVRVDGANGREHELFLAVPAHEHGAAGPVEWNKGADDTATLRGFNFPSGTAVEFVYPKAEAAQLAKLNLAKVVAIDPTSEGKPVLKKMSPDDLREVNLWLLSLTTTGPDDRTPAMLAQRYQPVSDTQPMVARSNRRHSVPANETAGMNQPAPPPAAPVRRQKPVVAVLPHTASQMPVIALIGLASLLVAGGVEWRRRLV